MIKSSSKTIAVAGTRERLVSTQTFATMVTIRAKESNTNNIFIGDDTVSSSSPPLKPGQILTLVAPVAYGSSVKMDISQIWLDSAVNGEGVDFWYMMG